MPSALSALIVDRLAPASRQKLQTPLSDATTAALRQMGVNKLLQPVMTAEMKAELIAAGYGAERLGGFVLSPVGHVRAMMETGQ
jgi:hypothetical protein